jgi:uncharacterized membrane protein
LQHYSVACVPLMASGAALSLLHGLSLVDWATYMKALSVFGLLVPVLWAPLMLKTWHRRWQLLCLRWERKNSVYYMLDDQVESRWRAVLESRWRAVGEPSESRQRAAREPSESR